MKIPSISFALALMSSCAAVPAMAQNTIIDHTGLGNTYVSPTNGATYPFVNISPGMNGNGGSSNGIAAGNINIVPGLFTQKVASSEFIDGIGWVSDYTIVPVSGSITFQPIGYGPGSLFGAPLASEPPSRVISDSRTAHGM
jgi:hypothetical protein